MIEHPLEQARRHVLEGEVRIVRQKKLLAELVRDGHEEAASQAERFLIEMEAFQRVAEDHLAEEIKAAEGP